MMLLATIVLFSCAHKVMTQESISVTSGAQAQQTNRTTISEISGSYNFSVNAKNLAPEVVVKEYQGKLSILKLYQASEADKILEESGPGSIYEPRQTRLDSVLQLDLGKDINYHIPLDFAEGNYLVSFEWAQNVSRELGTFTLQVIWNGYLYMNILPSTYATYRQLVVFKSDGNTSQLSFSPGTIRANGSIAAIFNLRIYQIGDDQSPITYLQTDPFELASAFSMASYSPKNLLQNGDFEYPRKASGEKIDGKLALKHWLTGGSVGEVGNAGLYSSQWEDPKSNVIHLDVQGGGNMRYFTFFRGTKSDYYIDFEYAPHEGYNLDTSAFSVYLNGKVILSTVPKTNQVRRQFIKVQGSQDRKGINFMLFVGQGLSDGAGATIDNIRVHKMVVETELHKPTELADIDPYEASMFVSETIIPKNMILNGAFEMEILPKGKLDVVQHLQNWIVPTMIEIGQGSIYNEKWSDSDVVAHITNQTQLIFPLQLNPGYYTATFDWAPHQSYESSNFSIQIKWNGRLVLIISQSQESRFSIYSQDLFCKSTGESDLLSFVGAGQSSYQGITISNLRIYKTETIPFKFPDNPWSAFNMYGCIFSNRRKRDNFISNGDFQFVPFFNVTDAHIFTGRSLPHWKVSSQGEIGLGKLYSDDWDINNYVIELDSVRNTEYTTSFRAGPFFYSLSFDYAPRKDYKLETSKFSSTINGKKTFSITPFTYKVRRQFFTFQLSLNGTSLGFRGQGDSDMAGATIDNIEVHQLS